MNKLIAAIQHHYQVTTSFKANFKEQITPAGGLRKYREGVVYIQKPGKMRWEFAAPEQQTIVSDGITLYSYEPDLNQVIETPLKQALRSSGATSFLLGMGDIRRDFDASLPSNPSSDSLRHIILRPRGGKDRIEFAVDPKTYDISALILTDQLGDVTELKFDHFQDNIELADSLFTFTVPAGADIVKQPSPT
ncbi:MAG TPA: outer membrane lipoprotein carrier protein LolA [Candidatus Binataceae bacterium]